MQTTEQWWNEVSNDEGKMINWLKNQYHGEVTAEKRIRDMILDYNIGDKPRFLTITKIANDEAKHAGWVRELLEARGITAKVLSKEARYWNETLPKALEMDSFEYMCAVAHLAETMRLERIKLLSNDDRFKDIAEVFTKILPDEEFHAKVFGDMSTPEDIEIARKYHNNGLNAIGLVA